MAFHINMFFCKRKPLKLIKLPYTYIRSKTASLASVVIPLGYIISLCYSCNAQVCTVSAWPFIAQFYRKRMSSRSNNIMSLA